MIIFISLLLYTIQLVLQHCKCINLIDLQQGGAAHSPKWKLESRRIIAPAMFEREMADALPGNENERDINLKNKVASLFHQTMHDTDEAMKDIEPIKEAYREEQPYKAGFVLSMMKKSRDVVNELFNVAIKHRDEWQALEQLKIFEIIVHTNIDTNHLLRQLMDIQSGRDVVLDITLRTTAGPTIADAIDITNNLVFDPFTESSHSTVTSPVQQDERPPSPPGDTNQTATDKTLRRLRLQS